MDSVSPLPWRTPSSGSSLAMLYGLVWDSRGRSRSQLAQITGLAPSTISLKVDRLIEAGLIVEDGAGGHRGRVARRLRVNAARGYVASIDLGLSHVEIALADLAGAVRAHERFAVDLPGLGPAETAQRLWGELDRLTRASGMLDSELLALTVGIPAPVQSPEGRVTAPAFSPLWHDAPLRDLFATRTTAQVSVENDANLYAIAECPTAPESQGAHLIAVKLGTKIGCGVIAAGALHRGFDGVAGEMGHGQAAGSASISCSCGVPDCLESVASGAALIARLGREDPTIRSLERVVEMGERGDSRAVDALRDAGGQVGAALSNLVNFLNPQQVVLAGEMSRSSTFVAAIRAELYRRSLPLMTRHLEVRTSTNGSLAVIGGLRLALDTALHPGHIDRLVDMAQPAAARG